MDIVYYHKMLKSSAIDCIHLILEYKFSVYLHPSPLALLSLSLGTPGAWSEVNTLRLFYSAPKVMHTSTLFYTAMTLHHGFDISHH